MSPAIPIIIVFFAVLLSGLPISFVLLITSFFGLLIMGVPFEIVPQAIFQSLQSFPIMALPFFVMLANILSEGGAVQPLVDMNNSFMGRVRGALGLATIFSCAIFAALVGSSCATAMAFGRVSIPEMRKQEYPENFALGIAAVGGTLGILIPPSLTMIIYAIVAETSIGDLFIAGIFPGLVLTMVLALTTLLLAQRYRIPKSLPSSWREKRVHLVKAMPILVLPLIILGGIYLGIATPTEVSAIGVAYAILIIAIIYKFGWKRIIPIAGKSFVAAAMIMFIITCALLFGRIIAIARVPDLITGAIQTLDLTPVTFLLFVNVLLLILGCFFEGAGIILIFVPLLLPTAHALGIDLVHLGIILVVNLEIGMLTPPIGFNLFVISRVGNAPVTNVVRGVVPYFAGFLVVLGLVTYWPTLSLWLPSTMWG